MTNFSPIFLASLIVVVTLIISFTTFISALANGRAAIPNRGVSTWCTGPRAQAGQCGRDVCNEAEIKNMVLTLESSGLYDLGYNFIWIDDCWEADERTANGTVTWDTTRFPSGMPSLISFVKQHNMELGLYLSLGNTTCDKGGRHQSIPGSEGHYQLDVDTLASWNCTAIKGDWCGFHGKSDPDGPDGIEVGAKFYKEFSSAIMNNKYGLPIYFQGVAAIFFLWGETPKYVNDWRASVDHHDNWDRTVENIAFPMTHLEPLGRPGAWADLDVLMTGGQGCSTTNSSGGFSPHCPGMTNTEYLTEFTIWNVIQSPLSVATDISAMTPIMKTILYNEKFLRMQNDTRTAPGTYVGGDSKNCPFLGRELCSYWVRNLADGSVFLVLLNVMNETKTIDFNFGDNLKYLPQNGRWHAQTSVNVEDLWADSIEKTNKEISSGLFKGLHHNKNEQELLIRNPAKIMNLGRPVVGSFSAQVDAHGVAAVLLKPLD